MGALPSCGKYGDVLDVSTDPYVECQQCGRRFVGGTCDTRVQRWSEHADFYGCRTAKMRIEKVSGPGR